MQVRIAEQDEDARVTYGGDGAVTLVCRPGLLSPRAFVALVLALEPLEQCSQYLQSTG